MLRVGFIGLGIMGLPMAINIARKGFPLTVYNRTKSKAQPLAEMGVPIASSPSEVARSSDVVIGMVTDAPDVEAILFGPGGVVEGAREGLIFIDMSTNSPEHAKSFAARLSKVGVEFLDAPVTGGDKGAREGTLTIMVGGRREVFDLVRPVLEAMGKVIVYGGDVGSGQLLKLCNQIVVGIDMMAVGEGRTLARGGGARDEAFFSGVCGGAAKSFPVSLHLPKII